MTYRNCRWIALMLVLAMGVHFWPISAQEPKGQNPDQGKGKRVQEFIEAYNKGDAKTVAAFWALEATYVDMTGQEVKGRDALHKMYEEVFKTQRGARLKLTVTSAREVTSDVAIEDGISEVLPAEGGVPTIAQFSTVLVKKEGQWYFLSVRESPFRPASNASHFQNLDRLIGDWVGEAEKGESARISYAWADNQNFIVSTFTATLNSFPVSRTTQWIAWDALEKQVRSWSFYSGGGFGESVWTKNDNQWSVKVSARLSDGKKVTVTHVLTLIDNNQITWQPTKLVVDGQAQPDRPAVKLKRSPTEAPLPESK